MRAARVVARGEERGGIDERDTGARGGFKLRAATEAWLSGAGGRPSASAALEALAALRVACEGMGAGRSGGGEG